MGVDFGLNFHSNCSASKDLVETYLIFVIFFTQAKFLENKINGNMHRTTQIFAGARDKYEVWVERYEQQLIATDFVLPSYICARILNYLHVGTAEWPIVFDCIIIGSKQKHNKWREGGAGEQQLIRADSQLLLLSNPVTILNYMNGLRSWIRKVKFRLFAIIIRLIVSKQQVIKKSKRGAEKETDLTSPHLSPLHPCLYLQLRENLLELHWLLQNL